MDQLWFFNKCAVHYEAIVKKPHNQIIVSYYHMKGVKLTWAQNYSLAFSKNKHFPRCPRYDNHANGEPI